MSAVRQRHMSKAVSGDKGDVTMEPSQGTGEVTTEPNISAKPGASETICPDTEQSNSTTPSSSETLCPSTAEAHSERSSSNLTSSSSSDINGSLGDISNSRWSAFLSARVARQTEETRIYQDTNLKPTLIEDIIYVVFILLAIIIAISLTSVPMYSYKETVSDLFLGPTADFDYAFKEIHTVDDFWDYFRGPILSGLYPEVHCVNPEWKDVKCNFYENKLVGVPRIRQLRVRSQSCQVHNQITSPISKCFPEYSTANEDQTPFNMYLTEPNNTAWRYYSESELNGGPHTGLMGTYSGGGYYADLAATRKGSEVIIENLMVHDWIVQRDTRAVFIDFTMYNKYTQLLCIVRLVVEFPGTGSALLSWSFRTMRMTRFCTMWEIFILACEILCGCLSLFCIALEMLKIKKLKWSYFNGFWHILDLMVFLICLTWAGFTLYRTYEVENKLAELKETPDVFTDFDRISYWDMMLGNAVVAAIFLDLMKMFRYVSFHTMVANLLFTLELSATSLAGYCLELTIGVMAFAVLGCLMFGPYVQEFSSFTDSMCTLGRMLIGYYPITKLYKANCIFGLPFFMGLLYFVLSVCANMVITINDAYQHTAFYMDDSNESHRTDYRQRNLDVLSKLNLLRTTTSDLNLDPMANFEEWRKQLKSDGYKEHEIEMLYATYEITFGGDSDEESKEPDGPLFTNDGVNDLRDGVDVMPSSKVDDKDTNDSDGGRMQPAMTGTRSSDSEVPMSSDSEVPMSSETRGPGASNTKRRSRRRSRRRSHQRSRHAERDEFSAVMWNMGRASRALPRAVAKSRLVRRKILAMEEARTRRWEVLDEMLKTASQVSGDFSETTRREFMERLIREELEELEEYDSDTLMPSGAARAETGAAGDQGDRVCPAEAAHKDTSSDEPKLT